MFYEGSRNVPSLRNGTYTLNSTRSWICPRTMGAQGAGETAVLRALSCQGDTSQEVGGPGREEENTQLGAARSRPHLTSRELWNIPCSMCPWGKERGLVYSPTCQSWAAGHTWGAQLSEDWGKAPLCSQVL